MGVDIRHDGGTKSLPVMYSLAEHGSICHPDPGLPLQQAAL